MRVGHEPGLGEVMRGIPLVMLKARRSRAPDGLNVVVEPPEATALGEVPSHGR